MAKGNAVAHNRHKLRVIENSKRIMKKTSICRIYIPDDKRCGKPSSLVFEKSTPIKVSQSLAWSFDNIRTHWFILAGAFCRDQQGKHYANYTMFQAVEPCNSIDISAKAQAACHIMFLDSPMLHRLTPFWLAIPALEDTDLDAYHYNNVLQTAHAYKVFNKVRSNFESNVNKAFVDYHTGQWFNLEIDWRECSLDMERLADLEQQLLVLSENRQKEAEEMMQIFVQEALDQKAETEIQKLESQE